MTIYKDELDQVLAETSTKNKTVIIAIINKAYVEGDKSMFNLFLDCFWLGDDSRALRDHLLIVAVDQTSHERCKFLQLHCYKFETDGADFEGEKLYMSVEFIKMMWRRTLLLGDVLKRGYNFIFTHSNCCRSISAKVADLTTVIHDWKRFKRSSSNKTLMFEWSRHTACENSWRQ
ncbi:Uncharacterized protein LOK49_LG07G00680 [Camellia lanceoleosa]|uniref:Uncharacterized protein n=1 Tax=Camellia lanceoleosa TaxID=1840588 RepID=A0ACC0H255_9ERIC|nr:Uncharacterized protein LOK49_LG07G00680 [Camellia lanceoleosa]